MQILWKPTYQEFQELLTNEFVLKILVVLSKQENMRGCAANISTILGVHVSTAKKYLELLHKYQFVKEEFVPTQPGKPTYYTLKTTQIQIALDLNILSQSLQSEYSIPDLTIREKRDLYPRLTFTLDVEGMVKGIIFRKRTKARRNVTHRIELTTSESNFMKHLPLPTMQPESFLEICKKAQITDYFIKKSLFNFVQKMKKLGVIEELQHLD